MIIIKTQGLRDGLVTVGDRCLICCSSRESAFNTFDLLMEYTDDARHNSRIILGSYKSEARAKAVMKDFCEAISDSIVERTPNIYFKMPND